VAVEKSLAASGACAAGFSTEATLMVAARIPLARCAAMRVSSADVVGGMGGLSLRLRPDHGAPWRDPLLIASRKTGQFGDGRRPGRRGFGALGKIEGLLLSHGAAAPTRWCLP
jgi:hypothetical protein